MRSLLAIAVLVSISVTLLAAEPADVTPLLTETIIGSDLPMAEVQRYCEARVPRMPELTSAEAWRAEADRLRREVLDRVVFRGQAAVWRDAPLRVEWLDTIEGGPGYKIRKLRYEALPGLWIPALLYLPDALPSATRVPAILNVNGHTGLGKQYPPKQIRCINQAKRGMIALNIEWVGMGQLRGAGYSHARMNQLDLCGTSGLAPFYLSMSRAIDLLLTLEHTDPERIAVTGLSGGGWQTIVISALDPRVALSNPVAGYSSFRTRAYHLKDLGDSEQTPTDLATIADYTHLTAMLAPRPALLTYNSKDQCCFESGYALQPLLEAARPVYRLLGREDSLRSHINDDPGTHNFERDNRQALYRMLGEFFYPGDKSYDAAEIPSDDEVKSEAELAVELPADNADFQSLALQLAASLPRGGEVPDAAADKTAFAAWQTTGRQRLRSIVAAKDYRVQAIASGEAEAAGVKARRWKLMMDGDWTVPAVELVRGEPQRTAILIADGGRAAAAEDAARLLADGYRVVAVDPFYFGESKIASHAYLFALLTATVGDRPLGIQASQLTATARWCLAEQKTGPVTIVARGPRTSLIALTAAALEPDAVAGVERHESLASLKEVIEQNWSVSEKPEMFCFGLLEAFDIPQLAALGAK
ncbi:MAG: acetylxylan esterase [Pirellulaceae bacterium]|nr:acetylxylan esterase [Pirellulaceae bacterium]